MTTDTEWQAIPHKGNRDVFCVAFQAEGVWVILADDLDKATAHRIAAVNEMERALEFYVQAEPQCECTPHSGCQMADARRMSRAALAKAQPK